MVFEKRTYACWEVHLHREDTDILGTLVEDRDVGNIDGRGGRHWFGGGHGDHDVCRIYKQLLEDVGRRRRRLVRHNDGGDEQEEGGVVMGVGGEGGEGRRGLLYSSADLQRKEKDGTMSLKLWLPFWAAIAFHVSCPRKTEHFHHIIIIIIISETPRTMMTDIFTRAAF